MISKKHISFLQKLYKKKYRSRHKLFIAEGYKLVQELLDFKIEIVHLYITNEKTHKLTFPNADIVSNDIFSKISNQKTPSGVLGVFKLLTPLPLDEKQSVVVLDSINNPGNLGTIIRLCDWYGIKHIICSPDTVDCFNPKVIQSSMGSIARISIHYLPIDNFLSNTSLPIYVTTKNGTSIEEIEKPKNFVLLMGNESTGVKHTYQNKGSCISIIRKNENAYYPESLNVAIATAICLSRFR